ncbi:flagellar biosynthesis anti-sigma factor FlgM [Leminorella grimontii]|nr:flagellar biosynthesis anti-sigma factor FlgM [Leminorella grimontii]KFC93553.1 hypothetical protein GLGR_3116 [Leminorella grimontii ATCC 33999 = DSM 5078]VFS55229.1 anti-sigma28 factor FlgM [Leminorella grimontii]
MKITPMPIANQAARLQTQKDTKATTASAQTPVPATPSADDIVQLGLQSAQETLSSDDSDIDAAKVDAMRTALANGELTVDSDDLAKSMLNFFSHNE